jgi:hypothetical protein
VSGAVAAEWREMSTGRGNAIPLRGDSAPGQYLVIVSIPVPAWKRFSSLPSRMSITDTEPSPWLPTISVRLSGEAHPHRGLPDRNYQLLAMQIRRAQDVGEPFVVVGHDL